MKSAALIGMILVLVPGMLTAQAQHPGQLQKAAPDFVSRVTKVKRGEGLSQLLRHHLQTCYASKLSALPATALSRFARPMV
jgi:hypothetical protein